MTIKLASGIAALGLSAISTAGPAKAYDYTIIDVPGATSTTPTGINASGAITGNFIVGTTVQEGFIYSGGTYTTIAPAGGSDIKPTSINAAGAVAGSFFDGSGTKGFLYS
jgi:hypothetical protein